jgi:hypothetical protein
MDMHQRFIKLSISAPFSAILTAECIAPECLLVEPLHYQSRPTCLGSALPSLRAPFPMRVTPGATLVMVRVVQRCLEDSAFATSFVPRVEALDRRVASRVGRIVACLAGNCPICNVPTRLFLDVASGPSHDAIGAFLSAVNS